MNLNNYEKMDVNMLFSIINMKLRDEFESLEELCNYYDIEINSLKEKMICGGYLYNKEKNSFK